MFLIEIITVDGERQTYGPVPGKAYAQSFADGFNQLWCVECATVVCLEA